MTPPGPTVAGVARVRVARITEGPPAVMAAEALFDAARKAIEAGAVPYALALAWERDAAAAWGVDDTVDPATGWAGPLGAKRALLAAVHGWDAYPAPIQAAWPGGDAVVRALYPAAPTLADIVAASRRTP
jgi:hypothetical protein